MQLQEFSIAHGMIYLFRYVSFFFLTAMLESLKQGVYVAYVVIHIQDGDEADS